MDYCTAGPQYASGGFIADSQLPITINGSQQQYLVRDGSVGGWSNGVWNQVFAGVEGAPAQNFPPNTANGNPYTTLATTPASREKPYLFVGDDGGWNVFVPDARTDSAGTTWADGHTPGHSIPLSDFYVARPGDTAKALDSQLARGKNLLLTPGVYDVDRSLDVKRSDTVVLGLGLATLTATHGAVPVKVADVKGVSIAGLTLDAGTPTSPLLMQIGTGRPGVTHTSPADPTTLSDVFFRIGGPHAGSATVSLEVNSNNVILDDIWAWRADHGNPGSVGWDVNTARATASSSTATTSPPPGCSSSTTSSTTPSGTASTAAPSSSRTSCRTTPRTRPTGRHDGEPGWAAYKVADDVTTNELWGGGSVHLHQREPDPARRARLRGAGDAGRPAARPAHGVAQQRRHHRPRRQRHRSPRRAVTCRQHHELRRQLPLTTASGYRRSGPT